MRITQYRWSTMMLSSLNTVTQIYIDRHTHNAKKSTLCQRLFVTSDFFYLATTRLLVTGFTVYKSHLFIGLFFGLVRLIHGCKISMIHVGQSDRRFFRINLPSHRYTCFYQYLMAFCLISFICLCHMSSSDPSVSHCA